MKGLKNPSCGFSIYNSARPVHHLLWNCSTISIVWPQPDTSTLIIIILWNALSTIDLYPSYTLKKTSPFKHFLPSFDPSSPCTFCCLCPCSRCHSNNYYVSVSFPHSPLWNMHQNSTMSWCFVIQPPLPLHTYHSSCHGCKDNNNVLLQLTLGI